MNIVTNEKLIKRNSRIGQVAGIFSMLVLGVGMYLTFQNPELFWLSWVALLSGFLISQIGIYYSLRWGRRPRPDEHLDKGLKGLDKRYSMYHFSSPVSHLLIGPAGIWVIVPKNQRGTITYQKGRWKQKGGGFILAYLKFFAQEGIGRPDLEIISETDSLKRFLQKSNLELDETNVKSLLVFTHPDVDIQVEDETIHTLHVSKLKAFIRKTAKEKPISIDTMKSVQTLVDEQA